MIHSAMNHGVLLIDSMLGYRKKYWEVLGIRDGYIVLCVMKERRDSTISYFIIKRYKRVVFKEANIVFSEEEDIVLTGIKERRDNIYWSVRR